MSDELVTLTVDGKEVSVPKGTNLIEAAKQVGVEIPHYCYHKNLSIVGNCRMCQMEVEGAPKLMIGCHTQVQPDMKVKTHETSEDVKDAQASTLEFILINHPLDCTVCDQSGHCKLQDYHFEYNGQESRFVEEKVEKVKAEPLGPNVILDGERCIMCTRCIRFCDEVTGTSELGMLNRGDRSVIAVNPGKELNNPLSGSVVDLCPVGALTHRQWRFNTRIWYTKQADTICPGCSTGCNVKASVRDNQIVHIKARENQDVNKEWLCDEGRYGFNRFIAANQLDSAVVNGENVEIDTAIQEFSVIKDKKVLFFVSPDLLLEDYYTLKEFIAKYCSESKVAVPYKERDLTDIEKILISPDYAANFKALQILGLVGDKPQEEYEDALKNLADYEHVIFLGDRAILEEDLNAEQIAAKEFSAAMLNDTSSKILRAVRVALPVRGIFQKGGLLVNRQLRLQYTERLLEFTNNTHPEWRILNLIAEKLGAGIVSAKNDREMTLEILNNLECLSGLKIKDIKQGGVGLEGKL